jgi:hypothetical protein
MLRSTGFRGGYYDWPPPPLREVRRRWLRWLGLAAASLAVLALVTFVIGHDDPRQPGLSDRAWLTLTAAALLLVALSLHHRLGALALLRALTEYAVVALLAVLLTLTALPAATQPAANQPAANRAPTQQLAATPARPSTTQPPATRPATNPAGPPAKGAGDGCPPVKRVPAWLACLWRQSNPPQLPGSPPRRPGGPHDPSHALPRPQPARPPDHRGGGRAHLRHRRGGVHHLL